MTEQLIRDVAEMFGARVAPHDDGLKVFGTAVQLLAVLRELGPQTRGRIPTIFDPQPAHLLIAWESLD